MPTRADMAAAIPYCPRTGTVREGRMMPNERCCEPLHRTVQTDGVGRQVFTSWRCSRHGVVQGSELVSVVARVAA